MREAVLNKARKIDGLGLPLIAERLRRLAAEQGAGFEGSEFQRASELVERVNEPRPMSDEDRAALEDIHEKRWISDEEFAALSIPKGTLTREEWADMRSHPDRSFRVLKLIKWPRRLSQVPEIARDHHEKLTGDGYTRGLSEDQISFDARIIAVADVYDALTANDRPYKPAIPHDRARKILESMASERALDARLVGLFFEAGCFELAEDKPEEVNA